MKKVRWTLGVVVLGVCWGSAVAQLALFNAPSVETPSGKLRGKHVLTREGRKIRAFLGVPYAKAPVDELRFKSPEPVEPWDTDRWAVDHPKPCIQPEKRHGEPTGKEDCLYLNIYTPLGIGHPYPPKNLTNATGPGKKATTPGTPAGTPEQIVSNEIPQNVTDTSSTSSGNVSEAASVAVATNVTTAAVNGTAAALNVTAVADADPDPPVDPCEGLLPVLVFFPGGGFEMGHSEPFTHEYLMDAPVILVTVQYRLGILGFFSTGDSQVPGNMGLKDQRMALRWLKENIEYFGGCPNKMTIMGDGAGGASVHYHLLFTPPKNATFRAGISMSGTALSPWAFRPPVEVSHTCDRLAALSRCPRPSELLTACLRQWPAHQLVDLLNEYKNETREGAGEGCGEWAHAIPVLGGVLENSSAVADAFITTSPWERRVATPWLVGVTGKEFLYEFTPQLVDRKDKLFKELDKCFNDTVPKVLGYQFSNASGSDVASAVRSFYFNNEPISRELFADVIDAVSDAAVVYPAFEAVRRAGRKTTYLYHFDYTGSNTYGPTALDGRIAPGRGDDLFYLFPRPLGKNIPRRTKENDTVMSRTLIAMWTNFATHLDPTPEDGRNGLTWAPTTPSTTFLNISQESSAVERPFLANRMSFWSLQDYPYREDDYGHDYEWSRSLTGHMGPMSMDMAPVTADRMADLIHGLREARIREMSEAGNETAPVMLTPAMILDGQNLTSEQVAEMIHTFRISQPSDLQELNKLRYAVAGQMSAGASPAAVDVGHDTLERMSSVFHNLRSIAADQDISEVDVTPRPPPSSVEPALPPIREENPSLVRQNYDYRIAYSEG